MQSTSTDANGPKIKYKMCYESEVTMKSLGT